LTDVDVRSGEMRFLESEALDQARDSALDRAIVGRFGF
jgi:hypothetical protein